ncbi:hypothetical protein NQZ79_g2057 [Umbelopsis isabellina]|nr:hypothetical protein NQZ79_g2057 [Umbelopsis isabellina]
MESRKRRIFSDYESRAAPFTINTSRSSPTRTSPSNSRNRLHTPPRQREATNTTTPRNFEYTTPLNDSVLSSNLFNDHTSPSRPSVSASYYRRRSHRRYSPPSYYRSPSRFTSRLSDHDKSPSPLPENSISVPVRIPIPETTPSRVQTMISRFQTAVDYGISPALFGEPDEDTYSSFRKINTPEGPRVIDTRKHTLQTYEAPAKRRRVEVEDAYQRADRPNFRVRPRSPVQRTSPTPARVLRDISGYAKYGETLLDQPESDEDESQLPDILGADNFDDDDDDDQAATEDVLDALFGRDTDQHQVLGKFNERETISTKAPDVPRLNANAENHSVGYVNDELLNRVARQTAAEDKLHSVLQDEIRRTSRFKEDHQNISSKKPNLSDELRLSTVTEDSSKDHIHDVDLRDRRGHANEKRTAVVEAPEPVKVKPVASSPQRQQSGFTAKLVHTTTPPRLAVPIHNHKVEVEVEVQGRRRSESSEFTVVNKKETVIVDSSQRRDRQRSPASKRLSLDREQGHLPLLDKVIEHKSAHEAPQANEDLIDEELKAPSESLKEPVVHPVQQMSSKPASSTQESPHQTLAEAIFEDDLMKSFDEVSDLENDEEAGALDTGVDQAIGNVLDHHENDAAHAATPSIPEQSHVIDINDDKESNEPVQLLHPTEVHEVAEDEQEPEYEEIEDEEDLADLAQNSSSAVEEVIEEDDIEIDELDDSYPDEVEAVDNRQEEVSEDRRRSSIGEQPNVLQPVETGTEEVYDEEKENRIPSSPAFEYEEQVQSAGSPVEVQVYEDEDNIAPEDQSSPEAAELRKEEVVTVATKQKQNEREIDEEERELDKSLIDEVEMMTTEYQDDISERRRSSNGRKVSSTSERSHIKHQAYQTSYEVEESDHVRKPAGPASDEEEQALDQLLMQEVDAFEDADSAMSVEKENNAVPARHASLLPRTPSPLFDNQYRERLQSGYMGQPRSALEVIRDTLSQSQLPTPPRSSPKVKVTKGQEVLLKRMETTELNRSAAQLQSSYNALRPNRPGPQRELNEMDVVAEAINEVITPYQSSEHDHNVKNAIRRFKRSTFEQLSTQATLFSEHEQMQMKLRQTKHHNKDLRARLLEIRLQRQGVKTALHQERHIAKSRTTALQDQSEINGFLKDLKQLRAQKSQGK